MSCEGCGALQKEHWSKGRAAFRCMHEDAGYYRGRVIDRPMPERTADPAELIQPLWCPKREEEE